MEKVTMYRCEYCGNLFDTAELSAKHEQRHRNIDGANEMLREGANYIIPSDNWEQQPA